MDAARRNREAGKSRYGTDPDEDPMDEDPMATAMKARGIKTKEEKQELASTNAQQLVTTNMNASEDGIAHHVKPEGAEATTQTKPLTFRDSIRELSKEEQLAALNQHYAKVRVHMDANIKLLQAQADAAAKRDDFGEADALEARKRQLQQLKVQVGQLDKAKREAKAERNWRRAGELHNQIESLLEIPELDLQIHNLQREAEAAAARDDFECAEMNEEAWKELDKRRDSARHRTAVRGTAFTLVHRPSGLGLGIGPVEEDVGSPEGWSGKPYDDAHSHAAADKLVPVKGAAEFFLGGPRERNLLAVSDASLGFEITGRQCREGNLLYLVAPHHQPDHWRCTFHLNHDGTVSPAKSRSNDKSHLVLGFGLCREPVRCVGCVLVPPGDERRLHAERV